MNTEEALDFLDKEKVQSAVDDMRTEDLFQMMEDLGREVPQISYQGPTCDLRVGSGHRGDDWIVEHYSDEQACACVFGLFILTFGEWLGVTDIPHGGQLDLDCTLNNFINQRELARRIDAVFGVLPTQDQITRLVAINDGQQQNEAGETGRAAAMSEFKDLVNGKLKGGV